MQQDDFDPYRKWLGIQPKDQPPNHYRLLALELFEDDPDTISNAADRQMAHLRTFQTGSHSKLSQKLLNECAAARICLLNKDAKADYDADLRAKMPGALATTKAELSSQASLSSKPAKPMPALPVARPLVTPAMSAAPAVNRPRAPIVQQAITSNEGVLIAVPRQPPRSKKHPRRFTALASGGGVGVGLLVIAVVAMSGRNHEQAIPANKPSSATNSPATKGDQNQLAQDSTTSQPSEERMAPAEVGPAQSDPNDLAGNAEMRRDGGSSDEPLPAASGSKPSENIPEFFTDDDSDAADAKAPAMGDNEDFFSNDEDGMPDKQADDGKDFFDSEN